MSLELNTRMNNEIRAAIKAKAFTTSGIEEAKKALIDKRAAFAEVVRQAALSACDVTEQKLNERYTELKAIYGHENTGENGLDNFIRADIYKAYDIYVDVAINGQRRYLYLNGSTDGGTTHIDKYDKFDSRPWVPYHRVLLSDQSLVDGLIALDGESAAIKDKEDTFNTTMDAVLQNARTVKQLLTAWPEAKELLPESMQKATGTALAINPAELNALCGIPSPK